MAERRTVIFERRKELIKREPVKHQWPEFLVSAPHAVACDDDSASLRRPYGAWHARRVGALQTACGMSAVTWQIFWWLRFDSAKVEACGECASAVRDELIATRL